MSQQPWRSILCIQGAIKLKYPLFIVLLVASATLVAALFASNSWNFNRGIVIGNSDSPDGFPGYRTADRLPRQVDRLFARQQRKNFAMASLLMMGLSALLAALLASRIVKPVVHVSQAVTKISRGDYAQRITRKRRDELGDLSRDVNQLATTVHRRK